MGRAWSWNWRMARPAGVASAVESHPVPYSYSTVYMYGTALYLALFSLEWRICTPLQQCNHNAQHSEVSILIWKLPAAELQFCIEYSNCCGPPSSKPHPSLWCPKRVIESSFCYRLCALIYVWYSDSLFGFIQTCSAADRRLMVLCRPLAVPVNVCILAAP